MQEVTGLVHKFYVGHMTALTTPRSVPGNNHYIQLSWHDTVPGRPDELYYLPKRHNSEDQKQPIDVAKLDEIRQHIADQDEANDCKITLSNLERSIRGPGDTH